MGAVKREVSLTPASYSQRHILENFKLPKRRLAEGPLIQNWVADFGSNGNRRQIRAGVEVFDATMGTAFGGRCCFRLTYSWIA